MSLTAAAQNALSAWGLDGAELTLVAHRENIVFRAQHCGACYALRLHRPGYQSAAMIQSELAWIQHLASQGLTVPTPLPTRDGTLLKHIDGHHANLLTWLPGTPLGATGAPLELADRTGTFQKIGALMARLHQISDAWDLPQGFERRRWDIDGLLGDAPHWDRFWDNPGLTAPQRARILAARDGLRSDLGRSADDFGLIHADMLRENVLLDRHAVGLIDFDDSGFGYRLFDVATTLFKNRSEPDYPALHSAFLQGYQSLRPLDTTLLPQFLLIRALTYLGWIIRRRDEPGSDVRQARFLASALPLVDAYLSRQKPGQM